MWKMGIVTPLPKKGDCTSPSNIRPITITHICGKLLERIVSDYLIDYFEHNEILCPNQMGFRKGRSTTGAISKLVTDLNLSYNNNEYSVAVYIDFSKAFDSISPNILLHKLKIYGIDDNLLKWLKNYFTDRSQVVRIDNTYSNSLNTSYGVPQGSILGPLMFITYINDLPNLNLRSKLIMYADDLVLYYSDANWLNTKSTIENELAYVYNWTLFNRLTINFSKSKFQVFGTKQCLNNTVNDNTLVMLDKSLDRVYSYPYLGIVIDCNLTFETAMLNAYTKFTYRLYTLSIIRKDIDRHTAVMIVKSMMLPFFDYVIFLSSSCTDKIMTKLHRIVNKALRIALLENRFTPTNELYDKTKVMKLDLRARFNVLKIMHHKVYNNVDVPVLPVHAMQTRAHAGPILPLVFPNSTKFKQSFAYYGNMLWNSLPPNLRLISNLDVFKKQLKKFVMLYN